jgi:predicted RNase H-like HicB family nuclease
MVGGSCGHVSMVIGAPIVFLEGDTRINWDEEMNVKYAVIFERAESNWAAYVPGLPGCMTTGRTIEETQANIREAIRGHLETMREFGDPVPPPTSVAGEVEITTGA